MDRYQNNKELRHLPITQDSAESEKMFARIVYRFTGEWYFEKDCDFVAHEDRIRHDEIIYFGSKEGLEQQGNGAEFLMLSRYDKFESEMTHSGFLANFDPECRKRLDLEEDKNHIVFYNKKAQPRVGTFGVSDTSFENLVKTMRVNNVLGTPKWGESAYFAVSQFNLSALVYMLPTINSVDEAIDDWHLELMNLVNETIQNDHDSETIVPIVWSWTKD